MKNQDCSRTNNNSDIKSQLKNFISLLQKEKANSVSIMSSGKLSVIMSASEPQSSSLDKQNSNPSANRSYSSSQIRTDNNFLKQLIKTGLTKQQQSIVNNLSVYIDSLVKTKDNLETKLINLQNQLNLQKQGTDQLLNALMKMDQEQKQLWNTYNQLNAKYKEVCVAFQYSQKQIILKQQQNFKLIKDLEFMKKLVYVANQSYEQIQKKCNELNELVHHNLHIPQTKSSQLLKKYQKSSADDILSTRRSYQKRHGLSPSKSDISRSPTTNTNRSGRSTKSKGKTKFQVENNKQEFQQIYRKMIARTLKHQRR